MAGQRQDGLPIADAAVLLNLSAEALRKRLNRGTLDGYKQDGAWFVVLPPDAPRQDAMSGRQDAIHEEVSGRQDAEPIEGQYTTIPTEIERAIERTSARYVADFASLYDRIAGEVGELYEAQLAAKDQALAAKDETITELRRRAEAAEAERDELRQVSVNRLQIAEPAPVLIAVEPPAPIPRPWWRRIFGGE